MSPFIRQLMKEEHEEQKLSNASNTNDCNIENVTAVRKCERDKNNKLCVKELSENKDKGNENSDLSERCGLACPETEGACGKSTNDDKSKKKETQPTKEARLGMSKIFANCVDAENFGT